MFDELCKSEDKETLYFVRVNFGRKQQQGQQQHGGTCISNDCGFTEAMRFASPPQQAINRQNSWYIDAMNIPWVMASASRWALGTSIAQYVAIATTWRTKRHTLLFILCTLHKKTRDIILVFDRLWYLSLRITYYVSNHLPGKH